MAVSYSSVCRQNSQAFSLKKSLGITLSGVLLQLQGCKHIFGPVVTHVEKVSSNETNGTTIIVLIMFLFLVHGFPSCDE